MGHAGFCFSLTRIMQRVFSSIFNCFLLVAYGSLVFHNSMDAIFTSMGHALHEHFVTGGVSKRTGGDRPGLVAKMPRQTKSFRLGFMKLPENHRQMHSFLKKKPFGSMKNKEVAIFSRIPAQF